MLRDSKSAVKSIFSKAIGVANSNVVELLAARKALTIYVASKWASSHRLIIKSDSKNVVKW